MSGGLGVYGILVTVITGERSQDKLSLGEGYRLFAAGLINGASSLVPGICLAMASWRANAISFVKFTAYRICIEALGLYRLIKVK